MENSWLLPLTVFLPWAGAVVVLAVGRAAKLRTGLAIAFAAADAVLSLLLIPLATSKTGFVGRARRRFRRAEPPAGRVRRFPGSGGGGDRLPGRGVLRGLHAGRRGTGTLLCPRPLLHRSHGRPGALRESPDGGRVLGDHGSLLMGAHFLPQRRSKGSGRRHQGAHRHRAGRGGPPGRLPGHLRAERELRHPHVHGPGARIPAAAPGMDRVRIPGRGSGQVRAVPLPDLAAGCHGSAHADIRPHPRGHHGERRRVSARPVLSRIQLRARVDAVGRYRWARFPLSSRESWRSWPTT